MGKKQQIQSNPHPLVATIRKKLSKLKRKKNTKQQQSIFLLDCLKCILTCHACVSLWSRSAHVLSPEMQRNRSFPCQLKRNSKQNLQTTKQKVEITSIKRVHAYLLMQKQREKASKLRLIVMSTNLEQRARERQRKRESGRQGFRARDEKPKETFFCWKNNMKILCSGGD